MNTIKICPQNHESMMKFQQILNAADDEKPIVEMNETTARDMHIISASIDALAINWRGLKDICIPGMPINRQEFWGEFSMNHLPEILPLAKEFIKEQNGQGKIAIDLGSGNSPAVKLLLARGWHVIAVDNSKIALNTLKTQNQKEYKSSQLQIIEEDVSKYVPKEPADLVIAADIFPYIDPKEFLETWNRIHQIFVKKDGFLVGSFFRSTHNPKQLPQMNLMKEMGAWFFPDRRMVRPLLTETGYEIKKCTYRIDVPNEEPICVQFIAKKK